jgi:tetratricopeptide (TPR) repeat protein
MTMTFARALLLYQQSRYDLAEQELRRGLAANPEDASGHALLALTLSEQEKKREALQAARQAVHLEPDLAWAHYALAVVLSQQDQYQEAERVVREALRLQPEDASYWALLSGIYLDQRRWPAALEAAERGLTFEPEHVSCANLRAMALIKLGRRQESDLTVGAALAQNPENALTHANQGWILLESNDHRRAMDHFREALRLDPTLEWARSGIVEALKARNIIYRYMLHYFFWMSRLDRRVQWGVIFGGFIGYRLVRGMASTVPGLASLAGLIIAVYLIFVYLTWSADTLFNLLLRLDRFGRLALNRDEVLASNLAGASLLIGLAGLALWAVAGSNSALTLGITGVIMVVPIGGTFKRSSHSGRTVLIALTVGLALLGLAGAFVHPVFTAFFGIGVFTFTIVANVMATRG